MRQKIQNRLRITVEGEAMTTVTDLEFYIRQGTFFWEGPAEVEDDHTLIVTVPKETADRLVAGKWVQLQFAYTDAAGVPQASDVLKVPVGELLKESGYDG